MPMQVKFGTFIKDLSSTQLPTSVTFTEFDCQLKDSCSIESPVLIIKTANDNINWNYAHIPMWNRYYFIGDRIIQPDGRTTLVLVEDYLASWRTSIINSSAWVARSAKRSLIDYTLDDELAYHNNNIYTNSHTIDNSYFVGDGGTYIVSIAGITADDLDETPCGLRYIAMNAEQMQNFIYKCYEYQSVAGDSFREAMNSKNADMASLATSFFSPLDYVTGIRYFPISYTGSMSTIIREAETKTYSKFYYYSPSADTWQERHACIASTQADCNNKGYIFYKSDYSGGWAWYNGSYGFHNMTTSSGGTNPKPDTSQWNTDNLYRYTYTVTYSDKQTVNPLSFGFIPWDGMTNFGNLDTITDSFTFQINSTNFPEWTYANNCWFERNPNWSKYTLFVPCFGAINIDSAYAGSTLNCEIITDFMTGDGTLKITLTDGTLVDIITGKIGIDVPVTNLSKDMESTLNYASAKASKRTAVGSAIANTVAGVGVGAVMGNVGGAVSALVGGVTGTISTVLNSNNTVNCAKAQLYQSQIMPELSTSGSLGSRAWIMSYNDIMVHVSRRKIFDLDANNIPNYQKKIGGKVMKYLPLSSCVGTTMDDSYLQVIDSPLNIPATTTEKSNIQTMLEKGIYLL